MQLHRWRRGFVTTLEKNHNHTDFIHALEKKQAHIFYWNRGEAKAVYEEGENGTKGYKASFLTSPNVNLPLYIAALATAGEVQKYTLETGLAFTCNIAIVINEKVP